MSIVLILGSGPNVLAMRDAPRAPFDRVVAINNAWRVRDDWDDLIYPEDMDPGRLPKGYAPHQRAITAKDFVPAQNSYGGFVYAGGTMAMTAGYWALHALRPSVIAFHGCDMVYSDGPETHFYGKGAADPLRADITLRSLEAKAARMMALAARQGCAMVNLSADPSRLVFPRAAQDQLTVVTSEALPAQKIDAALRAEQALGYMVPSGRYWEEVERFDPVEIDRLDALWLDVVCPTD